MSLSPITSPLLDVPGVRHAFFTREGGVSKGIYESLNVGLGSSDDQAHVAENRRRAAEHFGLGVDRLCTNYQIHSEVAALVETEEDLATPRARADSLVTCLPNVICAALAADCAPVLLADPEARVVAAVHAGWRGALNGVTDVAIVAMCDHGARPEQIVAVVGPCIGPSSYEVGLDFLEAFLAADAANARFFVAGDSADKRHFDLPGYVLSRLRAAGVERCAWTGHDTVTDEARFFSNRRAFKRGEPDFGRLLSAIALT